MKRRILTLVVATGFLVVPLLYAQTTDSAAASGQAAQSNSKQPNSSDQKGKEGTAAAVSMLSQATSLVNYARENESALAMLTAVQMLERVQVQDNAQRVGTKKTGLQTEGEQVKEGKKGNTPAPTLDPQQLLAEAKPWAKDNPNLTAMIDAEAAKAKAGTASGTLGSTRGAIAHRDSVNARAWDDYVISFYGGEVARIAVVGDGDTDVDLYVYDESGHLIAKDDDRTAECVVAFVPRWTGPFRVRVVNNGYVYSNYILMTN
jgi:hypothetical protein